MRCLTDSGVYFLNATQRPLSICSCSSSGVVCVSTTVTFPLPRMPAIPGSCNRVAAAAELLVTALPFATRSSFTSPFDDPAGCRLPLSADVGMEAPDCREARRGNGPDLVRDPSLSSAEEGRSPLLGLGGRSKAARAPERLSLTPHPKPSTPGPQCPWPSTFLAKKSLFNAGSLPDVLAAALEYSLAADGQLERGREKGLQLSEPEWVPVHEPAELSPDESRTLVALAMIALETLY
jgi:hypothetical protein